VDGDEVVQAYLYGLKGARSPEKTLVAFDRVHVLAGETVTVPLRMDFRQFSVGADTPLQPEIGGAWVVRPGRFTVHVGGGQPQYVDTVRGDFAIEGEAINMLDCIFNAGQPTRPVPELPPFDDDNDDDDGDAVAVGAVIGGVVGGLAVAAGGFALYRRHIAAAASLEKEDPLLGEDDKA
jgi:hypothetical protein